MSIPHALAKRNAGMWPLYRIFTQWFYAHRWRERDPSCS